MRTFHWNAPIIGAGALVLLVLSPAPSALGAETLLPQPEAVALADGPSASLDELRAQLDKSDRNVALQALEMALTEVPDGVTLVWRRPGRHLTGRIKPVSAFRDDQGRVCRRIVYSMSLGTYARRIEGIACREPNGRWSLSG